MPSYSSGRNETWQQHGLAFCVLPAQPRHARRVIFILAFIEVIRHIHTAHGTVRRVRNIGISHLNLNALVATIVVAMGFIGEGIISTREP
eukprot:scaffold1368_cov78-Skeletonema_dohrnii-CCMP3373.AAC.2